MLTIRERMCLDLAGRHEVDMSEPRFAQVVTSLLDRPDAEAELPQLVRRLRRVKAAQRRQRMAS